MKKTIEKKEYMEIEVCDYCEKEGELQVKDIFGESYTLHEECFKNMGKDVLKYLKNQHDYTKIVSCTCCDTSYCGCWCHIRIPYIPTPYVPYIYPYSPTWVSPNTTIIRWNTNADDYSVGRTATGTTLATA